MSALPEIYGGFMEQTHSSDYDGVRVQLFDAYMTPDDQAAYQADRELLGFRRFFGPERRDILMLWRNRSEVVFAKAWAESPMAWNAWEPLCIANTMASRCRSTIGKRLATTTSDIFRSIPTDENSRTAKVGQSTPNPTSCGPCMSGATRCSRMR